MNIGENWEDLKFVIALAKTQKLQNAAKLIESNHSTVYRRVSNFEEKYKIKLFESTPSGYFLTSAGEELYEKLLGLEDRMDDIFNSITGLENQLKGRITLTTTYSIACTFLPKILKKFQEKWPEVFIDLKVSNEFYNLSKREADIAIRPSSNVPLHLIGRNLGRINYGIYSNRSFKLSSRNFIKKINEYQFILLDESLEHLKSSQWIQQQLINLDNAIKVDDLNVMAKLCSEGVGLAVLPNYFETIYPELNLVYSPQDFIGSDLWILTNKNMNKVPKIKICTEFLYQELKALDYLI